MNNNDLKRVGLIFKEEGAVDFKKTLQEINLEMNKNYNQFKLTQAQWDNSTNSAEKLKAQQNYLTNAYEIQTDRVNLLRNQLQELESAEDKNINAIRKKQNELTKAEIKLKDYETKLKGVQEQLTNSGKKLSEFGEKIEKVGEKTENAGKKLSAFSAASMSALTLSAKSAIDFEDAFTGVEKTVDGTKEQMEELKQGIREMAKEIPSSTTEISAVAEAAGQLGIKTEDILNFTKVMIDLGNSTNLSADEAASALAKFANITNMSSKDYDKLGATIVALGNNFATTESDIVEMATRLAATGDLAGLSQSSILALATAISSVGIEAEAGGSAMSTLLKKIQVAVETGNESLNDFASVSGMTASEFKKAFEQDAVKALTAFISGLNDTKRNGKSAIAVLDDMGLTEVRLSNTILALSNASDVMNSAVSVGNSSWKDNTALTNEANKRYDTLKSKIVIAINKLKDLSITLGNKLMPSIEKIIEGLGNWIEKFNNLSDKEADMIVKIGLIVAAIGPLTTVLGKVISLFGGGVATIGTLVQAIGVLKGTITTTSTAVNGLASIISAVTSPVGIAVGVITALGGAYLYLKSKAEEVPAELQKVTEEIDNARKSHEQFREEIDKTTASSLNEMSNTENLRNELSKLVEQNGEVKSGYEDRVKFILNQLNEALGTEYSLTGNVISKYQELQNEIDLLISKKKAEIVLQNEEQKWTKALQEKNEAYKTLVDVQNKYNEALNGKTYEQFFNEQKQYWLDLGWAEKYATSFAEEYMQKHIDGYKENYEKAQSIYKDYLTDIASYENDYAIIQSNNTEKIKQLTDERINNYSRENLSKQEQLKIGIQQEIYNIEELKKLRDEDLRNQKEISAESKNVAIKSGEEKLQSLIDNLASQTSTINTNSTEIVEAWKQLASDSYSVYYDSLAKLPPELSSKIQEMTGVTAERTPELVQETENMMKSVLEEISKNDEFKRSAIINLRSFLSGMSDSELRELLKAAGVKNVEEVMDGIKNGNLAEAEGKDILNNLNTGLNNKSWRSTLWNTARNIASTLSGLLTVKASVNGKTSAIPGHKLGLDYVPKDNYVARLHKGERVLTKEENEEYTQMQQSKVRNTLTYNTTTQLDYNKMANAFLSALNKCKLTLDEDGFAKIIKNELYEVL